MSAVEAILSALYFKRPAFFGAWLENHAPSILILNPLKYHSTYFCLSHNCSWEGWP